MLRCVFLTMCFPRCQTMAHFSRDCYSCIHVKTCSYFCYSLVCFHMLHRIFFQVRTTSPVQYFLFAIVFMFTNALCVFLFTCMEERPTISCSSTSRDSSRDNWTSSILVIGCVTYIQLNSSLTYVYSRLTNLSFIGVRLHITRERSCSPYRLPGQVTPKAFPSAIHHFHVFASPTLSFYFCYSVDKQNFYSSCYRCCLFSMHWRIFASSCCYFVVFCIIGRISLMNILTFEHSVILDIFAFFDIVFHFISTFLFSSIGALFLYRHSLT